MLPLGSLPGGITSDPPVARNWLEKNAARRCFSNEKHVEFSESSPRKKPVSGNPVNLLEPLHGRVGHRLTDPICPRDPGYRQLGLIRTTTPSLLQVAHNQLWPGTPAASDDLPFWTPRAIAGCRVWPRDHNIDTVIINPYLQHSTCISCRKPDN